MAIGTLALCYNNIAVFGGVVKFRRGKMINLQILISCFLVYRHNKYIELILVWVDGSPMNVEFSQFTFLISLPKTNILASFYYKTQICVFVCVCVCVRHYVIMFKTMDDGITLFCCWKIWLQLSGNLLFHSPLTDVFS